MAEVCASPLSDSKMPKRCPKCQEKGIVSKVKKRKLFSQKRYFCMSELCTWPLTEEEMSLLSATGSWDSLEQIGSPLAQSTPLVTQDRGDRKETVVSAKEQEVRSEVESEQAEMSTPRTSRRKSKKRKKEKNTEQDGGESLEKKVRRLDMNPSEETRKVHDQEREALPLEGEMEEVGANQSRVEQAKEGEVTLDDSKMKCHSGDDSSEDQSVLWSLAPESQKVYSRQKKPAPRTPVLVSVLPSSCPESETRIDLDPPEDLYLVMRLDPHKVYTRQKKAARRVPGPVLGDVGPPGNIDCDPVCGGVVTRRNPLRRCRGIQSDEEVTFPRKGEEIGSLQLKESKESLVHLLCLDERRREELQSEGTGAADGEPLISPEDYQDQPLDLTDPSRERAVSVRPDKTRPKSNRMNKKKKKVSNSSKKVSVKENVKDASQVAEAPEVPSISGEKGKKFSSEDLDNSIQTTEFQLQGGKKQDSQEKLELSELVNLDKDQGNVWQEIERFNNGETSQSRSPFDTEQDLFDKDIFDSFSFC